MLLREAMNFMKSNTKKGWEKLPDGRKNKPEYAERAILEAMVNHFIHRDYTVMGGEVHLDIYDDRLTVTSPGGMYNGMLIQNLDIADVSSERRNPILANVNPLQHNFRRLSLPLLAPPMSETMTEMCRRQNSLNANGKSSI